MNYPRWRAPTGEGELLVWSAGASLGEDAAANRAMLDAAGLSIGGAQLRDLRRQNKAFISVPEGAAVVMTGHQVELHHAGVWVKNAVIHQAAQRLGEAGQEARAVHLAVDTDQPKHLALRYPTETPEGWQMRGVPVSEEAGACAWAGLLEMPTPMHLAGLVAELERLGSAWGYEMPAVGYLEVLRSLSLEAGPLVQHMTHASHRLEWEMGLRHDALMASGVWASPGFLLFAHELASRAGEFAASYNAALAEYRSEKAIRSVGRPMPDLPTSDDRVELPFWLDHLSTGERTRPQVRRTGGRWVLSLPAGEMAFEAGRAAEDSVQELKQALRASNCRLSPRALTLTLFCRVFLADLFVHGIGGGEYDQVTDRIVRRFFGIEPPVFAVATATMRPQPGVGRRKTELPPVLLAGHKLEHQVLGGRKSEYLARLAREPRRSAARRGVFFEMHAALRAARQTSLEVAQWQGALAAAKSAARDDPILLDRELFFAMHSRERLLGMIEKVGRSV